MPQQDAHPRMIVGAWQWRARSATRRGGRLEAMLQSRVGLAVLASAAPAEPALAEISLAARTDIPVGSTPAAFVLAQSDGPRLIVGRDKGLALVGPLDDALPLTVSLAELPFVRSIAIGRFNGRP